MLFTWISPNVNMLHLLCFSFYTNVCFPQSCRHAVPLPPSTSMRISYRQGNSFIYPQYNHHYQEINIYACYYQTTLISLWFYQLSQWCPLYQKRFSPVQDPVHEHILHVVFMSLQFPLILNFRLSWPGHFCKVQASYVIKRSSLWI